MRQNQWRDPFMVVLRLGILLGNMASAAITTPARLPLVCAYYYSAERRRMGLLFVAVHAFTFGRVSTCRALALGQVGGLTGGRLPPAA